MSSYVKSIDSNHMLEAGLEGFYGESNPARKQYNPGYEVGSDFITNNQIPQVDFATIHIYPDQWINGADDEAQTTFLQSWITSHTQDAGSVIGKPLLVTEFGRSSKNFSSAQRDAYFWAAYNTIYASARVGPCTGGLFWQFLVEGMDNFWDGYEVVFQECPSTGRLIFKRSQRISNLNTQNK